MSLDTKRLLTFNEITNKVINGEIINFEINPFQPLLYNGNLFCIFVDICGKLYYANVQYNIATCEISQPI